MKARHFGECRHFKNEDINGNGWCEEYEIPTHCASGCIISSQERKIREISSNYQNL